jgi:hypothetical protein
MMIYGPYGGEKEKGQQKYGKRSRNVKNHNNNNNNGAPYFDVPFHK